MRFGKINKFILFGGGQRLINFIEAAQGYSIIVITAPRLIHTPLTDGDDVEIRLKKHKVPYRNVESLEELDVVAQIDHHTLGISFGAPWIFRKPFIEKFQGRLLNGHGARLPKNRGGATFSWQILREDRTGCHLFHLVDDGVDTGDIIFQREFMFPETCRTPGDYKRYYQETEISFFREFLTKLSFDFDFERIVQDEECSTYFPRLSTAHHGWINWEWRAEDLVRFICAFDEPHEGASTLLEGTRVFLKDAHLDEREGVFHPFMSGLIFRVRPDSVTVAARDAAIRIRRVLDGQGHFLLERLRVGTRFVTPVSLLDEARTFKAIYTPKGLKSSS